MNVPGRWRPPTLFLLQSEGLDDLWHFSLLLLIVMIGFIMLGTAQFAGARRREFLKSYAKFSKVMRIMLGTAQCAGSRRREILKSALNRAFCIAPLYSTCSRPLTFENFCHWLLRISATLCPIYVLYISHLGPFFLPMLGTSQSAGDCSEFASQFKAFEILWEMLLGSMPQVHILNMYMYIYIYIYIYIYTIYTYYILYLILVTYSDNMH